MNETKEEEFFLSDEEETKLSSLLFSFIEEILIKKGWTAEQIGNIEPTYIIDNEQAEIMENVESIINLAIKEMNENI